MKGILINQHIKEVDELKISNNLPIPDKIRDGKVLVRVKAVGLGFPDYLQAQGKYQVKPKTPFILGMEFSGVVVKTSEASNFNINDEVFGISQGALAEYVLADELTLMNIPEGLSFEQASSILVNYPTNYIGLFHRVNLKNDQTILIHGSTGGVGLGAVQMAKMIGATVIATGSNDEKLKFAKSAGADHIINIAADKQWWDTVKKITDGDGVDVVYDPVGLVNASMKCVKFKGQVLIVGFAAGEWENVAMNRVLLKNISLVGLHMGAYMYNDPETLLSSWQDLFELFTSKKLIPLIYPKKYKLEDVPKIFKLIQDRKSISKIVVTMDTDDSSKL